MNVAESFFVWHSLVETSFWRYQHTTWCFNLATHALFSTDDYGDIIHQQVKAVKQT